MFPVKKEVTKEHIYLHFKFNATLKDEIKSLEGARWMPLDGGPKAWRIENSPHNRFQLQYLEHPGIQDTKNPYYRYYCPLPSIDSIKFQRPVYKHQITQVLFGLFRRQCILAAEMGTGKTLSSIEIVERFGEMMKFEPNRENFLYCAPKSVLYSVTAEYRDWKARHKPYFCTYDGLKKLIMNWPKGVRAPRILILDESSRLKNRMAQRTQTAQYLADQMRDEWGWDCIILLMSGSPAPKSPVDWWSQAEIACPGYLKEGNIYKFRRRLAVIETAENAITGGTFPKLITWRDSDRKCSVCGQEENYLIHEEMDPNYHQFERCQNEVQLLYERLKGLVLVQFKKDCTDLPEKRYKIIRVKPTAQVKQLAYLIKNTARNTVQALTLYRELSDGFQYEEKEVGLKPCEVCHGLGTIPDPEQGRPQNPQIPFDPRNPTLVICDGCNGKKMVPKIERIAHQIPCPKEDVVKDLLDEHEDVGRIILYAGFTGSVDRLVAIALRCGWSFIRADGRGWHSDLGRDADTLYQQFQRKGDFKDDETKIAFIAQASAAGMGLNLQASPTIVHYSNDFNWESRVQSDDRGHRPGMDVERGGRIVDLVHLPSDQVVLDNLLKKKRLQDMTLGELRTYLNLIESNPVNEGNLN